MRTHRLLVVLVGALALALGVLAPAGAAPRAPVTPKDSDASTDDKSVGVPTGWWSYTNVTEADVSGYITQNGARLTDIEIYDATTPTFTVTMVPDNGAYAVPGWWWYYGVTGTDVVNLLAANNGRLIDIEPYSTPSGIRFAVVMVSNSGAAFRNWGWLYGVSGSQITTFVTDNNVRLTDLESYTESGTKKYVTVGVVNTGTDAKSWEWWLNQSIASIVTKVNSFNGRIVSMQRQANGTYNFIQVKNEGGDHFGWRYYFGQTSFTTTVEGAAQFGMRLVGTETYTNSGVRTYDSVMIENLDAETRRIANSFEAALTGSSGWPAAEWGVYLKEIGGATTTALFQDATFEPASAIKAVHNLAVMRRVKAGTDSLGATNFVWYDYPNSPYNPNTKDACPITSDEIPANQHTSTLDFGRGQMMSISDNRTTRGVVLRYGLPAIQAAAVTAGMASTSIQQGRAGCAFDGGVQNLTTLRDLTTLYSGVESGTLLGTGQYRTQYYAPMNGGAFDAASGVEADIVAIVQAEGAALGLPAAKINSFITKMEWRNKGGSYNIPCDQPLTDCTSGQEYIRTLAGRVTLPFKSGRRVVLHKFVFARYVEELNIGCIGCIAEGTADSAIATVDAELFRPIIQAALETW